MTQAFIVIGPPRTGTSLTMGLLTKMGVWGGEDYREGPNNPCYYEDRTLFDWVAQKATAEEVVKKLAVKPKWGMKHPRIAERWDEFEELIKNPHFIITHRRNLRAQIKSHQRAIRKQSESEIIDRNSRYYGCTVPLQDRYPCLHVYFEDWFDHTDWALSRLAGFAGVDLIPDEVEQLINPSLRSDG